MKHEKISLKWKIFIYLLGFTLILIAILWMFQIVYLNTFYKSIKRSELNKVASIIEKCIDEENIDDIITGASKQYDVSVNVLDSNGESIYLAQSNPSSVVCNISKEDYLNYYAMSLNAGGSTTVDIDERERLENIIYTRPEPEFTEANTNGSVTDNSLEIPKDGEHNFRDMFKDEFQNASKSVVYINILTLESGEEVLLLINSLITPVDATVSTLRIQLTYITIIMLILALVIAFLISKRVSKSIIKVSKSAREFAKGNLHVEFEGKDYKEIAQLSDILNYAAGELLKTESLRKELIANVSHDLRTPLTMIIAYSEVMRDLPGENTPENVQVVIDEAKRLTDLVNDMLDISKLQAGVLALDVTEYNFTDSVLNVMERFSKLKSQEGYNITFEFTEKVNVSADEHKMHQVMYNLINNAINYTGEKKIVNVKQIVKGNIVRIEVRDYGIGIEPENIPYIWDRYYKVDKTHKRAVSGTGLGLSIVRNILELHKAKYGVNSQVGNGSVFWFELKIVNR